MPRSCKLTAAVAGKSKNKFGGCGVSYSFDFDSGSQILLARFKWRIKEDELLEFSHTAEEYILRYKPRATIVDCGGITSVEVSVEAIRNVAKLEPAMPRHLPTVVVAPQTHLFGMARIFQFAWQDKSPNLHVVRTSRQALALLGVQELAFEPIARTKAASR